jgi:V8-like Glu-specific endopeptidase
MKLFFLLFVPVVSFANPHGVIYGSDNRQDLYEVKDAKVLQAARATVALIAPKIIMDQGDGRSKLKTLKINERRNVCSSERFLIQGTAAYCTGFLVAPDIVITAGHCVMSQMACKNSRFVFDFALYNQTDLYDVIPNENIYECGDLIYSNDPEMSKSGYDMAVIRLAKNVANRTPIELERQSTLHENDGVFVLGHPLGLPMKVADNGAVTKFDSETAFRCDLDTYTGNSGSPVLNARTYKAEGILVSGEDDFVVEKDKCIYSKVCKAGDNCSGEEVLRAAVILPYLPKYFVR